MSERLYKVGEAAAMIRKSPATVKNRASLLNPPPQRVGKKRERLFTLAQIQEMKTYKERVQ